MTDIQLLRRSPIGGFNSHAVRPPGRRRRSHSLEDSRMDVNRKQPRRAVAKVLLLSGFMVAGTGFAADLTTASCGCSTIKVKKFYDANANGVLDVGEPGLRGWKMTLESVSNSVNSTKYTNWSGVAGWGIKAGSDYSLREGTPIQTNWVQSSPVDENGDPINPQTGIVALAGKTTWVKFGNYCKVGSRGRTPGFWSNRNGESRMGDDGSLQPELDLLGDLNLVDANGMEFNPVSHLELSTWRSEEHTSELKSLMRLS